jgi:hypothetical protein
MGATTHQADGPSMRRTERNGLLRTLWRIAWPISIAQCVAACSVPDLSQLKAPTVRSLAEPAFNPFAKKDYVAARVISQNELVDSEGHCPTASPAATQNAAAPDQPPVQRGIGLSMSECEVVQVLGPPQRIEINPNDGGQRSALMTYTTGERAGIYRFTAGRLTDIERGADAPPPPQPEKKQVKKKPKKPANA